MSDIENPSQDFSLFEQATGKPLAIAQIEGEPVIKVFDLAQDGELPDDDGTGNNAPFKKLSYATEIKQLNKGGSNKITIRPRVLIENQIDDTNEVDDLDGANTDIGQLFRLSPGIDNIERIHIAIKAIVAGSGAGAVNALDDFESYADTAALQAVWVPSDIPNTPNTLETTLFQEGAKAMRIQSQGAKQKSNQDTFTKTFGTPEDWSERTGIQFQFRRDASWLVEIHLEDSAGGESKHVITVSQQGVYELVKLNFADFLSVGSTPADLTDIKKVFFFIKTPIATSEFYIDKIETFTDAGGGGGGTTVDLELRDHGTDPSPTDLGTLLQTITIDLETGEKIYEITVAETGLTPNNFYSIVLTNTTATSVIWKGKTGGDTYSSGFAFKSTDDSNISEVGVGNDDFHFLIFARDKAIFNGIRLVANGDTGESMFNIFINDNASKKGKTALFLGETTFGRRDIDFPTKVQTGVSTKMFKDELVLVEYNDDGSSLATKIQATVYFTFINRPLNG